MNHGVPVLVVSKILGHSKVSTTLDIYGHMIPVMQEEAARIMDEIVTPIPFEMGEKIDIESSKKDKTARNCSQIARKFKTYYFC
jgi:hypothetical protein